MRRPRGGYTVRIYGKVYHTSGLQYVTYPHAHVGHQHTQGVHYNIGSKHTCTRILRTGVLYALRLNYNVHRYTYIPYILRTHLSM